MAGLADFDQLTKDPSQGGSAAFTSAWGDVEGQINLEASAGMGQVSGAAAQVTSWTGVKIPDVNLPNVDLTGAKIAMTDAFSQISSSSFGVDVAHAAEAAKEYVLMGQTVMGSVETLIGIAQTSGGARDQAVLAFTGTLWGSLTTIAVASGAVSAGLGAAITMGIGAILSVMNEAGLIGGRPSEPSLCGFPMRLQPPYYVGCMGMWGPQVTPGSGNWRPFPDPNVSADAQWFRTGVIGAGNWRGAWYGVGSPNADQRYGQGGNPNPAGDGMRPIDVAFPDMPDVHATPGPLGFPESFVAAWKANAAYGLNGLQAQADWAVFVHCLRMWNRAHRGPSVFYPRNYLIDAALNNLSSNDALVGGGTLLINVGPAYVPPRKVFALHLSSASSFMRATGMGGAKSGAGLSLGNVAALGALGLGAAAIFKPALLRKIGIRVK